MNSKGVRRLTAGAMAFAISLVFHVSPATAGELLDEVLESNAHRAKAMDAYRAGQMEQSAGHFEQALALRPGHPTLIYNLASVRARLGDAAGAIRYLAQFAALGIFADVAADGDFSALHDNPEFDTLVQQIASRSEPVIASSVAFTTSRPMGLIEGIAYDAPRDRFFLTSISEGVIYEVSASDGVPHKYLSMADHKMWGLMGIEIDEARNLMWVTSTALPQTAGYVAITKAGGGAFAVDLNTGRITQSFRHLPDGQANAFGELEVDFAGNVFIIDSASPRLIVLPEGEAAKAVATAATDFYSAQGIVAVPTGSQLIVADYGMGLLLVDPATGSVARVEAPEGTNLLGIDGLARHGNDLIAIQNGYRPRRVLRISMDSDWRKINSVHVLESAHPAYDEPTQGVIVGDYLYYIANSGWPLYGRGIPDAEALVSQKPLTVLKLSLK